MANRTYLFTRDHNRSVQGETDVDALCAGSTCIPLFWLTLFEPGSIITSVEHVDPEDRPEDEDEQEQYEYPYLVCPMGAAIERSRRRWPALQAVIGERWAGAYGVWISFLEQHRAPFIHCETQEYCWLSSDVEDVERDLRVALTAFEQPAWEQAGLIWKRQRLTKTWDTLFGLAAIDEGDLKGSLPDYRLCGYGYSSEVPWKCD